MPASAVRSLYDEILVWDSHAGFEFSPELDLDRVWQWKTCGVDFLSLNAGYDVKPWTYSIQALSHYRRFVEAHPHRYVLARTVSDIHDAKAADKLAVAFDMEGMCCLNDDLAMVKFYYDLGVRQMNFAYNLNNSAGGGCHDEDIGLTAFGRDVVREMNRVGMVVDCSHNSYRTSMEAIELSADPVVFSHSNARAVRDHERNIRDDQIVACANGGGVVGINGVSWFLDRESPDVDAFVRHLDYMVQMVGPAHVGIGLDYVLPNDSLLTTHVTDSRFWPDRQYAGRPIGYLPPESLLEAADKLITLGYTDDDVRLVFGQSFLSVAERVWK